METTYVLVGGGAFARELVGWLRLDQPSAVVRGYLGAHEEPGMARYSLPWLGTVEQYTPAPTDRLLMAIGDPAAKRQVVETLAQRRAEFASFTHSSAVIHPGAVLGRGVVVCPNGVVSADADVGDFVCINLASTVGHDVVLGAFSTLSAHVDLTGRVQVGQGVFFGSGARAVPDVRIGANARVGAGATVMRTVADGSTVYAPPAKRL